MDFRSVCRVFLVASLVFAGCSARPVERVEIEQATALAPTDAELVELASYVTSRLREGNGDADSLSARMRDDRGPRMVFLTVSSGSGRGTVCEARGRGVVDALEQCVDHFRSSGSATDWIRIDLAEDFATPVDSLLDQRPGTRGLVLVPGDHAVLPSEVSVFRLIDDEGGLQAGRYAAWLAARGRTGAAAPVVDATFSVVAAIADDRAPRVVGRRSPGDTPLTEQELIDASLAAGRYLTGSVKRDGRFRYRYWPRTDEDPGQYNILRHAGTTYAMYELLARSPSRSLEDAAELATRGLLGFVNRCPPPAVGESCIVEQEIVKLGGNGLAILALAKRAEVTGRREHLALMQKLARYMLAIQQPNGEFRPHIQRWNDGAAHPHVSPFYPGEAILGLVRLHDLDPDGPWLDAAERAARWLIEVRDGGVPAEQLPADHWLLYGLNDLHRRRPDPIYVEHAMKMARVIVESQGTDPGLGELRGAFTQVPYSTPNSTRVEGLTAAYEMARDFGTSQDAAAFRSAIDLGLRFVLQHQFRAESAILLPNPQAALGGFRRGFRSYEIRIDYVQHALSALLAYERILRSPGG